MNVSCKQDTCFDTADPQLFKGVERAFPNSVIQDDMADIPIVDRHMDRRPGDTWDIIGYSVFFHQRGISYIDISSVNKSANTAAGCFFDAHDLDIRGIHTARRHKSLCDRMTGVQFCSTGQKEKLTFTDALRKDVLNPIASFGYGACLVKNNRLCA